MKEAVLEWKDFEERYDKTHSIFCPYCHTKQGVETIYEHCSYWGEPDKESDEFCDCQKCGLKFRVIEIVERTFRIEAIEQK
jgi:hypothetical protein